MTEGEKIEILVYPEKRYSSDFVLGNLCGNKKFLDHIVNNSRFWNDQFKKQGIDVNSFHSISQLYKLPVLTREMVMELGEEIYVERKDQAAFSFRYSSGTTGLPLKTRTYEQDFMAATFPYYFRNPKFEYDHVIDFLSRRSVVMLGKPGDMRILSNDFVHYIFPSLTLSDLDDGAVRSEIYEKIEEAGPVMLFGFSSLILRFVHGVQEDKKKLPIYAIKLSSDYISSDDRLFIEEITGAIIINVLSSTGAGMIGFECSRDLDKFHVNSERLILEIIDGDGLKTELDEEGEMIVTAFDRTGTPMIRRALGDSGKMVSGRCGCGVKLPLFEFRGRQGDETILPSGKKLRSVMLYYFINEAKLGARTRQYQIHQENPDRIKISIVPREHFTVSNEVELRLALSKFFEGEKMIIDIEYVKNISPGAGGKYHMFVPMKK